MKTLRDKYHELGNKVNNALLFIGSVKQAIAKVEPRSGSLERALKYCELAEENLLTMGRELDVVKAVTYRFVDPNKAFVDIAEEFQKNNKTIRLLFVDDEVQICELLKRNYETRGFQVETASTVADAKNALSANPPHILVLDLYIEQGMDGVDILRHARQLKSNMKCLVVSREFDEDRLKEIKALGVEGMLNKPVMMEELYAKINGLISSLRS